MKRHRTWKVESSHSNYNEADARRKDLIRDGQVAKVKRRARLGVFDVKVLVSEAPAEDKDNGSL